ncbi:hypothetical protein L1987_17023 [Smallanthus sonchifolius]|uniref:Uncharacterized protein n=1 Tax=Smallanthus sonchifolius TaxID=185202 RepID=A0ACB9IWS7_9ASTR|nr:hypothetical protein L1987_17023 [Smallanthus sonchifolius]
MPKTYTMFYPNADETDIKLATAPLATIIPILRVANEIEKEDETTKHQLAKTDRREIQKFYQIFYEENIREGQHTKKP